MRNEIVKFLQAAGYTEQQAKAGAEQVERQEKRRRREQLQAGEEWDEQQKRRCNA